MGDGVLAAVLYAAGAFVLFGVRSWQQRRTTGSTGFKGFSRGRSGWARLAGSLFATAVLAGLVAPILAALGVLDATHPAGVLGAVLTLVGLLATVAGFVLAAVAQQEMAESWRIGVDTSEQTELVTGGLFTQARNPIFTGMIAAHAGTVLLAPTWLGILGVVALVVAIQIQVRRVEEPYLLQTHGGHYGDYAAGVGRFLPGVGRLPDAAATATTAGGSR